MKTEPNSFLSFTHPVSPGVNRSRTLQFAVCLSKLFLVFTFCMMGPLMITPGLTQTVNPVSEEEECVTICVMVWPNGYSEVEWWNGEAISVVVVNADLSAVPPAVVLAEDGVAGRSFNFLTMAVQKMSAEAVAQMQAAGTVRADGTPTTWPLGLPSISDPLQAFEVGSSSAGVSAAPEKAERDRRGIELLLTNFLAEHMRYVAEKSERDRVSEPGPSQVSVSVGSRGRYPLVTKIESVRAATAEPTSNQPKKGASSLPSDE